MTTETLTADDLTTGTEIVYQAPDRAPQTERDYYEPVRGTIVDVQDRTIHSGPDSSWEMTVVVLEDADGETVETNIEDLIGETDYRVGVVPKSESDDEDYQDDEDNEQEIAADGGSDASAHFSDMLIQSAIDDHNSDLSIEEVRTILGELQQSFDEHTLDWIEMIEEGMLERLESPDALILEDTTDHGWGDELGEIGVDHPEDQRLIMTIHRRAAGQKTSISQFNRTPFVFHKPPGFDAGKRYARHEFVDYTEQGLTPSEALDTIMVMKHGFTQTGWAEKRGIKQPSVSGNIKSGKNKIFDDEE